MSENGPDIIAVLYDESSIISHERLQIIRGNPSKYLDDTELLGQTQTAKEGLDNSLDEIALLGLLGYFIVTLCRDRVRGTYQIIIRDNGRGIPLGRDALNSSTFVDVITKPSTSGKFNQDAYAVSGGLFGQGLKEVAGFSYLCRVISHRAEASASLLVKQGNHSMVPEWDDTPNSSTGVTIVYEIDPTFFTGIAQYAETGYIGLIDLMQRYVFFRFYNMQFRISEEPIPEHFWLSSIAEADQIVAAAEGSAATVWNSKTHDPEEWIKAHWKLARPFTWRREYRKPVPDNEGLRDFIIRLYYVKGDQKRGDCFSLVNNVPIITYDSDNIAVVINLLRHLLSLNISETTVKEFFLKDYKIPIFIATDIKYKGAKFTGSTKYAFRDVRFREIFRNEVAEWLATPDGQEVVASFYELIEDDIRFRYNESLGGKISLKEQGRLFIQLNYPKKYTPCNARDRSNTELFLVEGGSAGGSTGYDVENQAIYEMSGKSLNIIAYEGEPRTDLISRIMKNKIFQDILTIINYDLRKPDLRALNFKSCLIGVDADPHGGHIASIVVGNFNAVAPELVASGFFGVVAPPYYKISSAKDPDAITYAREFSDLIQWCARILYYPAFHIDIGYVNVRLPSRALTMPEFISFAERISEIGEVLDNLEKDLAIPQFLIEALARCTYYLSPVTMNTEAIRIETGADLVDYDLPNNSLILTVGQTDYVIPLYTVAERIYTSLLPLLSKIKWKEWVAYVTTKRTQLYEQSPMSLYQIYSLFKMANSLVKIDPLKGIGSMDPEDAAMTCMNPRNRRLYRITEPGQISTIFKLLGDDSGPRKQLSAAPVFSDKAFT